MGFVDESSSPTPTSTDPGSPGLSTITDEEAAPSGDLKTSPYLHPRRHHHTPSFYSRRSPRAPRNGFYSPHSDRNTLTEPEEICEELEDDTITPLSPPYPRRSSARSTPSHDHQRPRSGDGNIGEPTESTSLLGRTGTGRSYRDRRRRRSAPHLVGLEGSQTQSRRRASRQQDALGGWWKMRWWHRGREDHDDGG